MKTHLVMKANLLISAFFLSSLASGLPATGNPVFFSTGSPDGLIAAATRPSSAGAFEIETETILFLLIRQKSTAPPSLDWCLAGVTLATLLWKSIGYSRLIPMSAVRRERRFFQPRKFLRALTLRQTLPLIHVPPLRDWLLAQTLWPEPLARSTLLRRVEYTLSPGFTPEVMDQSPAKRLNSM